LEEIEGWKRGFLGLEIKNTVKLPTPPSHHRECFRGNKKLWKRRSRK
jgi:hypothetical protein